MDTTTVHVADGAAEAEVVAGLLRGAGIEVITRTEASYTEAPTRGGEGTVEISVPAGEADRARQLIEDAQPADGRGAVG